MATKHVFDDPVGLVEKNLRGTVALNPSLRYYAPHKVVYNPSHPKNKVAVISGGGAGHEPAQGGFVGQGMLAAAISGDIFASPSAAQICSGIDLIENDAGVIMVVNNYTGDCLHFGLAAEKARSARAGNPNKKGGVETVNVADDVAVGRKRGGLVGRRGLAGNIFTCKILGAAADKGLDVKTIAELGRQLMDNMVAVGTSLDHCHVPGRPKGDEERGALAPDAAELGMGIHNEPGFKHMDKKPAPKVLIGEMFDFLLDPNDSDRAYTPFDKDDAPVLFVNNLGGMSNLEMNAITDVALSLLESKWSLYPSRVLCSAYMTSLNAPGFGISLVNQKRFEKTTGHSLLELLDAPTDAFSWAGVQTGWGASSGKPRDRKAQEQEAHHRLNAVKKAGGSVSGLKESGGTLGGAVHPDPEQAKKAISAACAATVEIEPELTKFDTIVGDGDCGETLAQAGTAVKKALDAGEIPLDNAAGTLIAIGDVLESAMGGTSGAIYALFFAGLVQSLLNNAAGTKADAKVWGAAALEALENLGRYTPARPGDRTLVDALDPFCRALGAGKPLAEAVQAARTGAESTIKLTPRLGRATYVGSKDDGELPPDPGAWGIWALTDGLRKGLGL